MPTVKVPLFSPVYRNVDKTELNDKSYELIDGYLDELGYNVRRPGLALALDLGYGTNFPIEGLFWWPQKSLALALCNNIVFKLTYPGSTLTAANITTNGPGSQATPTFTVGVDSNVSAPVLYGLMAAGGAIIQSNGTGVVTSNFATLADADAPTVVTHVDFIDGYVLATTGKGMFQYADVNAPTTWSALSYATAMRNPDILKALKVFNRQIFLIGQVSTEIWENDGVSPFAPTPGGFLEYGTLSPNSVVASSNGLYWLDHNRHFVVFRGGTIDKVPTPYHKEIDDFSDVTDCFGSKIDIRGRTFIMWQFPTEARTLVFNVTDNNWSEWSYWDSANNEYQHFLGKTYCYASEWGVHLMGSRVDSKIYTFSSDHLDDDGDEIRLKKVTGHIDYGTSARKRSNELRIKAKRGDGLSGGSGTLMLRWNDDNKGWSNEHELSLGSVGENETVIRFYPKGVYRTRQYEVTVTDAVNVIFGDAEEDLDILGR
jgi:hypothetical protein